MVSYDLVYVSQFSKSKEKYGYRDNNSCSLCNLSETTGFDCWSKPDPGLCYAYFTRYYYDPASHRCKSFIYGGCAGNGNRYKTRSHCFAVCAGT
ncbi:kunitz-type serine protease inhibitor-like isoform X1 [Tachypleus tridentatus]|uniref:kunitz-type serine protease inhibitor-like isoform X1 n=1 Tax=Tachypleus tridentatus TaxID=6853 RepID=UPI003FD0F1B4